MDWGLFNVSYCMYSGHEIGYGHLLHVAIYRGLGLSRTV